MVRRILLTALLILVCFVLQTSVFAVLPVTAATPNLMIILAATFGLLRGDVTGMVTGFFAGLITDIFYGDIIGFYALVYMYAGFVCGRFHKKFYPENLLLPFAVITTADLASCAVCFLFLYLPRLRLNILYYLIKVALPEALFSLIVALVLYPVILKINAYLEDVEQRSARKFV